MTPTQTPQQTRHPALVRVTHWLTALSIFALVLTGIEIVISHPRFYWGEDGNALMPALFQLPIPASRELVPTGYKYTLPDQNGWSRSLHFEAAWLLVFSGIAYLGWGLLRRHFSAGATPYSGRQRATYLVVIFLLAPLMVASGLAMSPAVVSVVPALAAVFGGQQSARTIHFFGTLAFVLFVLVHVVMVVRTGFVNHLRAMTIGETAAKEQS